MEVSTEGTATGQPPTILQIQHAVAEHSGLSVRDLQSPGRQRAIAIPRQGGSSRSGAHPGFPSRDWTGVWEGPHDCGLCVYEYCPSNRTGCPACAPDLEPAAGAQLLAPRAASGPYRLQRAGRTAR